MKIKKLITHNGSFHADDVFACATLCIMLEQRGEKYEIIRTRDEEIIKNGDYVFDIGYVYDAEKNKFDHHQKEESGKREDGIKYSSFGLIWEKFGAEVAGGKEAARLVDRKLVAPVDAFDNGLNLTDNKYDVSPYLIQHFFLAMCPSWREKDLDKDKMFFESVEIAKEILRREIIQAGDWVLAKEKLLEIYNNTVDKRIIIMDDNYPYEEILNKFPEPLFVVYPKSNNLWGVRVVQNDPKIFLSRKNFPISWAGLLDEDLQKVTGVSDATFCHQGLFIVVAKTKEGAVKLAQIAVKS